MREMHDRRTRRSIAAAAAKSNPRKFRHDACKPPPTCLEVAMFRADRVEVARREYNHAIDGPPAQVLRPHDGDVGSRRAQPVIARIHINKIVEVFAAKLAQVEQRNPALAGTPRGEAPAVGPGPADEGLKVCDIRSETFPERAQGLAAREFLVARKGGPHRQPSAAAAGAAGVGRNKVRGVEGARRRRRRRRSQRAPASAE